MCLDYCPVMAISILDSTAFINQDLCVECGSCKRTSDCHNDAFVEVDLKWPRSIRKIFSDPLMAVPHTNITGRGTEEMKTNEITNRFKDGEIGFAIDVGRPNVGTSFSEIEKITIALSSLEIIYEKDNPITQLFKNMKSGIFIEEIKSERVLSGVIEFKANKSLLKPVLETLQNVSLQVNTVFSIGIIVRIPDEGSIPLLKDLEDIGWKYNPGCKVNVALGKH